MKTLSRVITLALAVITCALAFSGAAFADHGRHRGEACRADAERLCADAGQDRRAVKACLIENAEALSAECQTALAEGEAHRAEAEARRVEAEAACGADVQTLCPDADGRRDLRQCLSEHRDDLSPSCQDFVAAREADHEQRRAERLAQVEQSCGADLDAFCPDAQDPQAIRQCLMQHHDSLSQACSEFTAEHRGGRGHHGRRGGHHGRRGGDHAQHRAAAEAACGADVQALCPDADGRREVRQCLNANQAGLSASCQAFIAERQAQRQDRRGRRGANP